MHREHRSRRWLVAAFHSGLQQFLDACIVRYLHKSAIVLLWTCAPMISELPVSDLWKTCLQLLICQHCRVKLWVSAGFEGCYGFPAIMGLGISKVRAEDNIDTGCDLELNHMVIF